MAVDITEFRRRAERKRSEDDEAYKEAVERINDSGILDLLFFGEFRIIVTNGVLQELIITSTHRPSRQKPIGVSPVTQ